MLIRIFRLVASVLYFFSSNSDLDREKFFVLCTMQFAVHLGVVRVI